MRSLRASSLLLVIVLTACGGTGSSKTKQPTISGNWQFALQSTTYSETETASGFLVQSPKGVVSGGVLLSGQTVSGTTECQGVGSATGQATGSNLSLAVTPAGQTLNFTGTSANSSTTMSGNYSILASGCGQTEVGTWTAQQVSPLTGSFQATFTSTFTVGLVFQFSGTVTQSANTGGSTATLLGTMTSSNSPCFSSATIQGVISGTSLVFNLFTADGIALGKYTGTVTTDGTSIAGPYRFSNPSDPNILAGCGGGDGGTAAFTVQ
jgi:hypothetical protein